MPENVSLKPGFSQVCVWPGTVVGDKNVADFEEFLLKELGVRAQYLEEILTAPDMVDGFPVEDTGGRNDLFFAVHGDDVNKFAVPRLAMGIRWLEDVLAPYNHGRGLYPERVSAYQTWPLSDSDDGSPE